MLENFSFEYHFAKNWSKKTNHNIGNNIWNRHSFKLKKRHVRNEPINWVRAVGAFEPIVNTDLFAAAGAIIGSRSQRMSDNEMIEGLKDTLEQHGFLSGFVINEAPAIQRRISKSVW